ncbi:unnamed protein product [Trichobilharzia regenti]|nr:unnamed protein product [Trichobilharzia regenti]
MLYLIGLGLGSFSDLTIKGLDVLKKCDYVYLDSYTSIFSEENINELKITEKCIFPADREFVEQSSEILDRAKEYDVAFLVIGDPLGATTHSDIILRAVERSIPYQIIHNASVITAVGCCGLHLYNFGITVSIPLWDEFGRPESFVDKILKNMRNGFHTLCLLDIKVICCQASVDFQFAYDNRKVVSKRNTPNQYCYTDLPVTIIPQLLWIYICTT